MKLTVFQSDKGDCLLLKGADGFTMLADGGMRFPVLVLFSVQVLGTMLYLWLHRIAPSTYFDSFFWTVSPVQWLDWLYWSGTGLLLSRFSILAHDMITTQEESLSILVSTRKYLLEIVIDWAVALITIWVLVNVVGVNVDGVTIRLERAPSITVGLAFLFGFYGKVTRRLLIRVLMLRIKAFIERLLRRALGDEADDQAYVESHIDPRLQEAYLMAASTNHGRLGHEASRKRRVGYKVAGWLPRVGFTVNAISAVYIGESLLRDRACNLASLIAHEASHVEQKYWSDSLQQEVKAYRVGNRVLKELRDSGESGCPSVEDWPDLEEEQAREEVKDRHPNIELYRMIPPDQKVGWLSDKVEAARQGGLLVLVSIKNFFSPLFARM